MPCSSSATRRDSPTTARAARAATARRSTCRASRRSSSARSSRRGRRSCSCSSPADRPAASGRTSTRRRLSWRGFRARRAAGRSPTSSAATRPGRQAPDLVPAERGQLPVVLRAQDLRRPLALEGRLRRSARGAALSLRVRPRLHDLRAASPRLATRHVNVDEALRVERRGREHGRARGRRGRPALRPRPRGERHAAGARAEGLRARRARGRARAAPSRSKYRSPSSASPAATCATSSSRVRSTSSSARRRDAHGGRNGHDRRLRSAGHGAAELRRGGDGRVTSATSSAPRAAADAGSGRRRSASNTRRRSTPAASRPSTT